MIKRILLAPIVALVIASQCSAQSTLAVGDISMSGYNQDAPDGFSFVLWKPISAGTVIKFTDNGFKSAGSATAANNIRGTENYVQWTAPAGGITPGTVIRLVDNTSGGSTVTGGGAATGVLSGLSNGGDQIFVYQGAGATATNVSFTSATETFSGTILFGLDAQGEQATSGFIATGPDSSNVSYLPSQLNVANGNVAITGSNTTHGRYSGARTGFTGTAARAAVNNSTNWTTAHANTTLPTTAFTLDATTNLYWDANGTTAGTGGAGTWDATTNNRFSDSANTTFLPWINSSTGNDHTAVFAGAAGTVTVLGGVTASGLKFDVNGYNVTASTVTLAGSTPTVTVTTAAHTATIGSELAGSNGMTKAGAGKLVLTAANTYSGGTVINDGIVYANNTGATSATGTGGVTVATGGNLGGTGRVSGGVTVNGSGVLGAGSATPTIGALDVGALTFTAAASTLDAEIDLNSGGTPAGADLVIVNGALAFFDSPGAGSTLKLTLTNAPATLAAPLTFILAMNDGVDPITGAVAPVTGLPAGYTATLSYSFSGLDALSRMGTGNDFAVTLSTAAVPEASAFLFGGAICAAACGWSWRQRRLRDEARV